MPPKWEVRIKQMNTQNWRADDIEKVAAELGDEGWELVAATQYTYMITMMFKRQRI